MKPLPGTGGRAGIGTGAARFTARAIRDLAGGR